MLYKGKFKFDRNNHPGECFVDDNNTISLIINESTINDFKKKITGIASNTCLSLYDCRLVGNAPGFYEYRAGYMTVHNFTNPVSVDCINYIQDFRFTFEPLDEWLHVNTLIDNKTSIDLAIPDNILLLNKSDLKIFIKYYREKSEPYFNSIKNLSVKPYICVKSKNIMKINQIMKYIQIITRFFALLIGFTGNVRNIKFSLRVKGKLLFSHAENDLIINSDFSNNYYIHQGYSNFRTYYSKLNDSLHFMFEKWFDSYLKYQEAIVLYFSPYNYHTVEGDFLNICKCLEKVSLAKENKKEKQKKNKQFHKILSLFYDKHKQELIDSMKKSHFKKEYIRNIETIHENIANSVVYQYDTRKTFSVRIKELDEHCLLKKHFNGKHISNFEASLSIYDYVANTRNYYTHLDSDKYIIIQKYVPGYCRLLEKILVAEFLKIIIKQEKDIIIIIKNDSYLSIYDHLDC